MEQTTRPTDELSSSIPVARSGSAKIFWAAIGIGFAVAVIIVLSFLMIWSKQAPDYTSQLNSISNALAKSVAQNEKPNDPKLADALQGYQAVFLSNGQVYFGKYQVYNSDYYLLTDIYYLQNGNGLQNTSSTTAQSPQISLVKLGNELHGPQDGMYLLKSSILFVENIKPDGQIARAIQSYKASNH